MSDFITGFIAGMIVVALPFGSELYKLYYHCEKELPRNESCILIAVPEKESEG